MTFHRNAEKIHSNRTVLLNGLEEVRQALQWQIEHKHHETFTEDEVNEPLSTTQEDTSHSTLGVLCKMFKLSPFERKLLLFCLGMEVCKDFAKLCAQIHDHPQCNYPTLSLAALLFPKEASWQTLPPQNPLRYWQLISCEKTTPFSVSKLAISERIMQFLLGIPCLEERLLPYLQSVEVLLSPIPSHDATALRIKEHWQQMLDLDHNTIPGLHLLSTDPYNAHSVVLRACHQTERSSLYQIDITSLPKEQHEWNTLWRLMIREAVLTNCVYLVKYDTATDHQLIPQRYLTQLVESLPLHTILMGDEPPSWLHYPVWNLRINGPTAEEQQQLWQMALSDGQLESDTLKKLVQDFSLNPQQIEQAALLYYRDTSAQTAPLATLWQYCREQRRQSLAGLAKLIEPKADWNDIVLPESRLQLLRSLIQQVTQRHKVYQDWGFAQKNTRGLGICALFTGPSGTGKTLAAEIIAHELQVDLFHIDLSMVLNKYIGETEKHLKKLFDLAETSGALLLFDEADALFGKRTEIKDSHDRYANLGVNYLLQRLEAYQGLSILTTNFKSALDDAFLRRIRFIVQFPFPDAKQRALIWQKIFPAATPTQNIAIEKLAQLNIAGGHIRNIALNAAFIAAEENQSVHMQHIIQAARGEYLKLEQPFPETGL